MSIETAPKEFCMFCSYDDAILYCFSLNIDGKTGWRLPTIEESKDCRIGPCWIDDYRKFYQYDIIKHYLILVRDI